MPFRVPGRDSRRADGVYARDGLLLQLVGWAERSEAQRCLR